MRVPLGYTELSRYAEHRYGFEAVWVSVSDRTGPYRVLPDGRCDIILKFSAKRRPISTIVPVITGPTTRFHDIDLEPGLGFVGVRMRPGFFERILGFEPGRLVDGNAIGEEALALVPALAPLCRPTTDHGVLAERLSLFVRARSMNSAFQAPLHCQNLISAFHASGGHLKVQEAAVMHGISERTVHRLLLRATGLAPKVFASILQFHRAMRLLRDHQLSPVQAALEAGYADQAHMSRAFRRIGGFSPARLPDVTLVTLGL
jgi:AraC-like DNA-binding protein